jgi:CheY-like chemotaxis protein
MKLTEASILFVDDEPGIRDIFEKWLLQAGCASVRTCADGAEALAVLAHSSFDLIVSDIRMPRVDGVTLVRRRWEIAGPIPCVVFISGFSDVVVREMYALGVEAFLPKPVRREEFFRTINRSLADRSELWTTRSSVPSRQLLTDLHRPHPGPTSPSHQRLPNEKRIEIGRGGFCLPYTRPAALGKIAFNLAQSPELPPLKGEGHVRWRSSEHGAQGILGIEFEWLDPISRQSVVDHIAATLPTSYIPDPLATLPGNAGISKHLPPLDRPVSPSRASMHSVDPAPPLQIPHLAR